MATAAGISVSLPGASGRLPARDIEQRRRAVPAGGNGGQSSMTVMNNSAWSVMMSKIGFDAPACHEGLAWAWSDSNKQIPGPAGPRSH